MTDAVVTIRLNGRLDSATAPAVTQNVLAHIDGGARALVFDCSDLYYVSSAGLRVILVAARKLSAVGGELALCQVNERIDSVLEVTGFAAVVKVYPDLARAQAALGKRRHRRLDRGVDA